MDPHATSHGRGGCRCGGTPRYGDCSEDGAVAGGWVLASASTDPGLTDPGPFATPAELNRKGCGIEYASGLFASLDSWLQSDGLPEPGPCSALRYPAAGSQVSFDGEPSSGQEDPGTGQQDPPPGRPITFTGAHTAEPARGDLPAGSLTYELGEDFGVATARRVVTRGRKSVDARLSREEWYRASVQCVTKYYLHLWIDNFYASRNGCGPRDITAVMASIERGVQRQFGFVTCSCSELTGKDVRGEGCAFMLRVVWHIMPATGEDDGFSYGPYRTQKIRIRCAKWPEKPSPFPGVPAGMDPPPFGWTTPDEEGYIYTTDPTTNPPPGIRNQTIAAHEMGHILFGTGGDVPPGWDATGHHKPPGLMTGLGLTGAERLTSEEACALVKKYAACSIEECCDIGPITPARVKVGAPAKQMIGFHEAWA